MVSQVVRRVENSHQQLASNNLTQELIEWVCHQIISCSHSHDRLELSTNLLENLYRSYLDRSNDENEDLYLDCKLKTVECMIHICDRQAFTNNELHSEEIGFLSPSRKKTKINHSEFNSPSLHTRSHGEVQQIQNNAVEPHNNSEEQQKSDAEFQEFWEDNVTLQSFTSKQWKSIWDELCSIWNFYFDTEKNQQLDIIHTYRIIHIKFQLYIILSWMKEKNNKDENLEFCENDKETELENIFPPDTNHDIYINLTQTILLNNKNESDKDVPLLQIVQSLLEQNQIRTHHINLDHDYFHKELNLHVFQSEVQTFLQNLYRCHIGGDPQLALFYQGNAVNFGAVTSTTDANDYTEVKSNDSGENSTPRETASLQKNQRNPEGFLAGGEEEDASLGHSEENRIIDRRKKRRQKRHRFSSGASSLFPKSLAEKETTAMSDNQAQLVTIESNGKPNSTNAYDYNDEFASARGSLESKTTRLHDADSDFLSAVTNVKEETDKNKAMFQGTVTRSRADVLKHKRSNCDLDRSDVRDDEEYIPSPPTLKLSSVPDRLNLTNQLDDQSTKATPHKERYQHSQSITTSKISSPGSFSTKEAIKNKVRRKFTGEERTAIKLGVEIFGIGRWREIKQAHRNVLQHRTNVNIKDCYRTMLKRGDFK